jgi:hypothetical protein
MAGEKGFPSQTKLSGLRIILLFLLIVVDNNLVWLSGPMVMRK